MGTKSMTLVMLAVTGLVATTTTTGIVLHGTVGTGHGKAAVRYPIAHPAGHPADHPAAQGVAMAAADRVLSGDVSFPDGFTVPAGQVWEFAADARTTVTSRANVIVRGVLRMRPVDATVEHTLRFVDVNESRFVGGGIEVLPTDVGLWVMGEGQLDIAGTPRRGWNRTGTDPTWRTGDEVRVAPTAKGDTANFPRFTPGSTVPTVSHAGKRYAAEVLNLTRNVRIEGTGNGEADPAANGRAHIFIHSARPQTIKHAQLRHLGPRKVSTADPTDDVLGRYPLHLHMMGDGARGTLIEGVVVRDSGSHAFVPHASHGVTFRDTIAFNTFESAYWWDPDDTGHGNPGVNGTNDLRYEHAMAALLRADPAFRGYGLAGFELGEGRNLTITDSVGAGIQGNVNASAFHWPATANGNKDNLWTFRNNVGHNNRADGIFVWQNDSGPHLVEGFVGYHNGDAGIEHGAYGNSYTYSGIVLFGNGKAGIRSHAHAARTPQRWNTIDTDEITLTKHVDDTTVPVVFDGIVLRGKVTVDERGGSAVYEFRNVRTASGRELVRDDFVVRNKTSRITVFLSNGTTFDV